MFNVSVKGTDHKDFVQAKKELTISAINKEMNAPVRATYAFGQKIGETAWEVKKAFRNALRSLNDYCMLATGKPCATDDEIEGTTSP